MNWKFWVKVPEVKTVDSVVQQFDQMIADLEDVAVRQKNEEASHAAIIAEASFNMHAAAQEHTRALNIADKIKALIS